MQERETSNVASRFCRGLCLIYNQPHTSARLAGREAGTLAAPTGAGDARTFHLCVLGSAALGGGNAVEPCLRIKSCAEEGASGLGLERREVRPSFSPQELPPFSHPFSLSCWSPLIMLSKPPRLVMTLPFSSQLMRLVRVATQGTVPLPRGVRQQGTCGQRR